MTRQYSGTKAQQIRDELLRQIRIGNFPRGSQLPSEQRLSEQLGVSHMTVRKAVADLTASGYLRKEPRIGTFINEEISGSKLQKQLGIVCPAWPHPMFNESMMHLSRIFEREGWICRYAFARHWEDRMIEEVWKSSDALVLFPIRSREQIPPELLQRLESQEKPVVYVGNPDVFRTDTVSFDDEAGIGMLLRELRKFGHTCIGRLSQRIPERKLRPRDERLFLEAAAENPWCRIVDFDVECRYFESPVNAVYRKIREQGIGECTVLAGSYSMILAAHAALVDSGFRVPEDVSLVVLGENGDLQFLRPRPAHCSFSVEVQAKLILELILRRIADPDRPVRNPKVPPCFYHGETLAESHAAIRNNNTGEYR